MLERVSSNPTFMKRIVTSDETWVYEFDMQTSQLASKWRLPTEPKRKKPRQSRSKVNVMLTVFFDYRGVEHSEFLPEGLTVNEEYYLSVMRRDSKFDEKGQICGKKILGFCITTMRLRTRLSL